MKNIPLIFLSLFLMCAGIAGATELVDRNTVEEPELQINELTGLLVGRNYEPGAGNDWKYTSLYFIVIENPADAEKVRRNSRVREILNNSISYQDISRALELPPDSKAVKVLVRSGQKYCLREGSVIDVKRVEGKVWKLKRVPVIEDDEDDELGLPSRAEVLGVIDGGTLILKFPNSSAYVRAGLMGVEIPDPSGSGCEAGFAREARDYVESLINKKKVRLIWDSNGKVSLDRRMMPYVVTDENVIVNAEVIRKGLGFVPDDWETDKRAEYIKLEEEARKNKSGIWGKCPPEVRGMRL